MSFNLFVHLYSLSKEMLRVLVANQEYTAESVIPFIYQVGRIHRNKDDLLIDFQQINFIPRLKTSSWYMWFRAHSHKLIKHTSSFMSWVNTWLGGGLLCCLSISAPLISSVVQYWKDNCWMSHRKICWEIIFWGLSTVSYWVKIANNCTAIMFSLDSNEWVRNFLGGNSKIIGFALSSKHNCINMKYLSSLGCSIGAKHSTLRCVKFRTSLWRYGGIFPDNLRWVILFCFAVVLKTSMLMIWHSFLYQSSPGGLGDCPSYHNQASTLCIWFRFPCMYFLTSFMLRLAGAILRATSSPMINLCSFFRFKMRLKIYKST